MSRTSHDCNGDRPLCFALGKYHHFLGSGQASTSTPEERIKSIWPFILGKTREFTATLTSRELSNFDEEDVLLEIWIAIRERDHKWNSCRGQYISFAGPIIHNCLYSLREKTRTVESATNTSSRLKRFTEEANKGELSEKKRKTMESMRRSVAGPSSIIDDEFQELAKYNAPDFEMIAAEEHKILVLSVVDIVRQISYEEASIIGPHLGLWGQKKQTFAEIACKLGKSCGDIKKTYLAAISRLSETLKQQGPHEP